MTPVSSVKRPGVWAAVVAALALSYAANDWLPGAAIAVIWIIWQVLPDREGPPVLALAMTYQWAQVTTGTFYFAITGRTVIPSSRFSKFDDHPIVIISLASLLAITLGCYVGRRLLARPDALHEGTGGTLDWRPLLTVYCVATLIEGASRRLAFGYPSLTQPILALTSLRLVILYMVYRRLAAPEFRWGWIGALAVFETLLNSTAYFASFREPLILAMIAVVEVLDWRKRRQVIALGGLTFLLAAAGLVWMSVRATFREEINQRESFSTSERFDSLMSLVGDWWSRGNDRGADVDELVARVWAVYYPGLAVQRVPSQLPHTGGDLMTATLLHIVQPRVFFPDKPELPSDSEMVRKYSGVFVAGREENTSIAFGYVPESYIDFGVPVMFVPMVIFGAILGAAYSALQRALRHESLRIAVVTVIFWLSLYLFERSWANFIGNALTMIFYVGVVAVVVDRFLPIQIDSADGREGAFEAVVSA